jgi:Na+/melibiose symporter-like transporter
MPAMLRKFLLPTASILGSIVGFIFAAGTVQYYVTRNLPGEDPFSIPKLCLNFAIAGFVGGVIYAAIHRHGTQWLAAIPSFFMAAIYVIVGATAPPALRVGVAVLFGIVSGLLAGHVTRKMLARS